MYAKYFVLFAILFTGWLLKRIKFIDDKMNRSINKLIVYFAYPCLIVHNIGTMDMTRDIVLDFLIACLLSLICMFIYAGITFFYAKARKYPSEISGTVELAMVMPNDGFMGFPVALIFFGEKGMLLMLAHNAAMNFFTFSYGIMTLRRNSDEHRKSSAKKISKAFLKLLVNPNILALFIGFAIGFSGISIPEPVDEYLLYVGGISTPMAMIYIGSSLEKYRFAEIIKSKVTIEASVMKLIIVPLVTIAVVYFLPVAPIIKSIVVLGGAFPTAATAAMLAEQENQAPGTASQILFLSTVASLLTVPVTINLLTFLF